MEQYFLNAVPDNAPYEHDYEGPDDMPSHIKSSMLGVSLMPVSYTHLTLFTNDNFRDAFKIAVLVIDLITVNEHD